MRIATCLLLLSYMAARADEPEMAGTPVSKPLQPVTLPDVPPAMPDVTKPETPDVKELQEPSRAVMPKSWSSYDLLLWWSKSQPIPNLVTASRTSPNPVVNGVDTILLVGGQPFGACMTTGFRFNMGWSVHGDPDAGLEFGGLFLGTRIRKAGYADSFNGTYASLGRPYIDATTGQESVLLVAGGGMGSGTVEVATTTRVTGWEVNYLRNLVDAGEVSVTALAGYRYLGVNESLQVQQQSLRFAPGGPPSVLWGIYDQFDARNNFQGGQIGFKIDAITGRWLFTFSGKVAFGTNFETVNVNGNSSATTAALPQNAVQPFNAGFLAVSSNSGRNMQSSFAVLPEAKLNVGFRLGDSCHFFAGYDFIYLSDAVRPGDQVDLTIDSSRSPVLNNGAPFGPARPRQPFVRSEFWVQGLVLGFDCRY